MVATMSGMALADLVDEVIKVNELTDRAVVRAAVAQGHVLTPSDMSLYRRQGMKTLVPAKVIALAAGLQIPAYRVAIAVLSDLGIEVPLDAATPERAVELDVRLPTQAKRLVLAALRQAREDVQSRS